MKILVLHHAPVLPLRRTIQAHLDAWAHHAPAEVRYLNLAAYDRLPRWALAFAPDVLVHHTTWLSTRWVPPMFARYARIVRPLANVATCRLAIPQDEFIHLEILEDFFEEHRIDHVFTLTPPRSWPKVYPRTDPHRIHQVLAGYVDEKQQTWAQRHWKLPRAVDIGYRAWEGAPWLGRWSVLKGALGGMVSPVAEQAGLTLDVSTRTSDTLHGTKWYEFIQSCRWVLGIEGGATILDRDGSLKSSTEAYMAKHPSADFDEVQAHCFPGRDGEVDLRVITPRHMEAAVARTGQVLVEGNYNGIMRAWRHYVPLAADGSNVEECVEVLQDESFRKELTENCYRDVVESGHHSHRAMIAFILRSVGYNDAATQALVTNRRTTSFHRLLEHAQWVKSCGLEQWSWRLYQTLRGER